MTATIDSMLFPFPEKRREPPHHGACGVVIGKRNGCGFLVGIGQAPAGLTTGTGWIWVRGNTEALLIALRSEQI